MITNWRRTVLVLLCVLAGVAGRVDAQGPWSQADPGFPSPTVDMMEPGTLATAQLPALKMIAVAATGYDVIDVPYCREHGIAVANIRNYAVHTVPEHAFALILALRRNVQIGRAHV